MTKSKTSKSNNSYEVGDRVFAKLKGYPWWPARIETVENQTKPIKYKILFYATYEINLIKPDCLVPFNKQNIEKYGEPRKYKYFNEAMNEIQNDPDLKNLKRRSESEESSDSQSGNDQNSNTSGKNSEKTDSNEFDETEGVDVEKQSTERSTSDLESKTESEKSFKKMTKKSNPKMAQFKKKTNENEQKPKIESEEKDTDEKMDVDDSETNKSAESNSDLDSQSDNVKKNSKRPLDDDFDYKSVSTKTRRIISDDEETTEKAEDIVKKEQENTAEETRDENESNVLSKDKTNLIKTENEENSEIMDQKKTETKITIDKNEKIEKSPIDEDKAEGKQTKFEIKKKSNKMTNEERESEKQKLKEKKIYEKKLAKLKSIRIQLALQRMNVEIRKCQREDNMDFERCFLLMQDLQKLPFTRKNLFRAHEIVETIRECKNFKKSEKVRQIADECFSKFYSLFSINPGDSFSAIFERERIKYLAENEDEIKREKIIAQKLMVTRAKKTSIPLKHSSATKTETNNISITNESATPVVSCMGNAKNEDDQFSKQAKNLNESFSLRDKKKE
ncbi:PC4 and SFRS1-interacting isoform X1 [Brachionus plicatilis]|uniref:PC4 and SFRS1-interacting isoform X1 n=1 Tax=Brachionus plicatilis TaxID=10195 RepID=A0A3M7R2C0_BRAPC|nr:PC4 and SFRS1-interacting isoform X1 [Brachionus plicatilis]